MTKKHPAEGQVKVQGGAPAKVEFSAVLATQVEELHPDAATPALVKLNSCQSPPTGTAACGTATSDLIAPSRIPFICSDEAAPVGRAIVRTNITSMAADTFSNFIVASVWSVPTSQANNPNDLSLSNVEAVPISPEYLHGSVENLELRTLRIPRRIEITADQIEGPGENCRYTVWPTGWPNAPTPPAISYAIGLLSSTKCIDVSLPMGVS
jgi:hypothetical protein